MTSLSTATSGIESDTPMKSDDAIKQMLAGLTKERFVAGLLLTLIATVCDASVTYPKEPLLEAFVKANVVMHAKIARIEPRKFDGRGRSTKCGTDYFIEVLETFKGRPASQRSFSFTGQPHAVFEHSVNVGDEMLLFLQVRKVAERPEGGVQDVIQPGPSAAEYTCLASLSPWTLVYSEAGGFPLVMKPASSASKEPIKWLAYASSRTELPSAVQSLQVSFDQNCRGEKCERTSRRMVPWLPLRAEILRSLGRAP